jgi:hypothetical protein
MRSVKYLIVVALFMILASYNIAKTDYPEAIDPSALNFDTLNFEHSMKGRESNGWPNGNSWNYSLIVGTNVLKTYTAVTQQSIRVTGTDSLKMLLRCLPAEEEVFWNSEGWLDRIWVDDYYDLCLPDRTVLEDITSNCVHIGLILMTGNQPGYRDCSK